MAVLPRSEDGLNSSNSVNGGLIALAAEEAVLSLAPGDTLRSLGLRYLQAVRAGPVGSGQVTKLLNNLLFTANLGAAASILTLGQALGVAAGRLADVISHGSGASYALDRISAAGGTLDLMAPIAGPLLSKDARLVADLAEAAGAPAGAVMAAADAALALMNQPARARFRER